MVYLRKYIPEIIILVYAIIFLLTKNPSSEWDRVIVSDGKGYYGYLTAFFIYQDSDYGFIDQYESEYYPASKQLYKDFRYDTGKGIVNKYFPGLSILWIPFFGIAYVFALVFDYPTDGYSAPFQWSIALAAFFYFWLSLLILRKILRHYTENETIIAWVMITTALATNLIYYTVNSGCQVHVYNFFLINAFIYSVILSVKKTESKYIVSAAFFLGMIIITRPQNVLIVLSVPFVCGSSEAFIHFFKSIFTRKRTLIFAVAAISFPLLIPVIYWYAKTGDFIVYSYGSEKYDLTKPNLISFLFSFEKGWLLYTPVAAFSLLGFIFLFKRNKWQFYSLAAFSFFIVYFLSSWWIWNYTSYIGQRVMIDYYAFVAILLVFVYSWIGKKKNELYLTIALSAFIAINIMQYFQQLNWIYPAGPVTAKTYFSNFFRFSKGTTFMIPEDDIKSTLSFSTDFENENPVFNTEGCSFSTNGYESNNALVIAPKAKVKNIFVYNLNQFKDHGPVILRFGAWLNPQSADTSFTVTVHVGTGKMIYSIMQHDLMKGLKSGKWQYSEMVSYLPYIRSVTDSLYITVNNYSGKQTELDNLKVEFLSMIGPIHHDWILAADDQTTSALLFETNLESQPDTIFRNLGTLSSDNAFSGEKSSQITAESPYSVVFENDLSFFGNEDGYIRIASQVAGNSQTEILLVFDFISEGKTVFYKTYPVIINDNGKWDLSEIFRELPDKTYKARKVKIYYWYVKGQTPVYIDDFHVDFVKYKPAEIPFRQKSGFETDPIISPVLCYDFESAQTIGTGTIIEKLNASSGTHVCEINQKQPYSSSFFLSLEKINNTENPYLQLKAKVNTDQYSSRVSLVADFKQNGKTFSYFPNYLRSQTIKGQWSTIDYGIKIPEGITANDSVLVYFYHPGGDEVLLIDDFCVSLRKSESK